MALINGIPEVTFTAGNALAYYGVEGTAITTPLNIADNSAYEKRGDFYMIPFIPYLGLTNDASDNKFVSFIQGFVKNVSVATTGTVNLIHKISYDYQNSCVLIPEEIWDATTFSITLNCASSYINPSGDTTSISGNFVMRKQA